MKEHLWCEHKRCRCGCRVCRRRRLRLAAIPWTLEQSRVLAALEAARVDGVPTAARYEAALALVRS